MNKNSKRSHHRKINWKLLLTRKVLFMTSVATVLQIVEHYLQHPIVSKASELAVSSLLDHIFFEIPFEES